MDEESLIEQVATAHRERSPDGAVQFSRAWHDLEPEDRQRAFEVSRQNRSLEAALDPEGLSSTAHAILGRIRRG